MKTTSATLFVSLLALAGFSYAQGSASEGPSSEIRMSTDPARAAEVEERAREIQARQQSESQMSSGSSEGSTKPHARQSGKKKHSAASKKQDMESERSGTSSGNEAASGTAGN